MNDLNQEAMKQKNELLSKMSSIILGTVSKEGLPNSSYAPSVVDSDGSMYIYISDLSKHTSNLIEVSQVSIMIIEDELLDIDYSIICLFVEIFIPSCVEEKGG